MEQSTSDQLGQYARRHASDEKRRPLVKPFALDEVKDALAEWWGSRDDRNRGHWSRAHVGQKEVYRGSAYVVDFVPKVRIEVVVPDGLVHQVLDAIEKSAKTGRIGDGKIFRRTSRGSRAHPHRRARRRSDLTDTASGPRLSRRPILTPQFPQPAMIDRVWSCAR